jgi:hypothetical protein
MIDAESSKSLSNSRFHAKSPAVIRISPIPLGVERYWMYGQQSKDFRISSRSPDELYFAIWNTEQDGQGLLQRG